MSDQLSAISDQHCGTGFQPVIPRADQGRSVECHGGPARDAACPGPARSAPPTVPVFRCACGKLHRTFVSRMTPCRDCGELAIYEWNGNPDGVCERDRNVGFDVLCDQAVAALIRLRRYTNDRGAALDLENTLAGLRRVDEARAGFDLGPLMTAARRRKLP